MEGLVYRVATQSASDPNEFVLSDETVDRYGEVVVASGWDLTNFRPNRNPIALFNHHADAIVGRWENVRVEGKRLLGRLVLAAAGTDEIVDKVRRLWEQKILRAVSVGFRPIEREPLNKDADPDWGPFRYLRQELVECSLVAVPANPNALQIGRSLVLSADVRRQLFGKPASQESRFDPVVSRVPAQSLSKGSTSMNTPITKQIENQQAEINRLRDQLTELSGIEERDDEQQTLFVTLPPTIEAALKNLTNLQAAERVLAPTAARTDPPAEPAKPAQNGEIILANDPKRPFALPKKKIEPDDYMFRAITCGIRAFSDQVPLDQALRNLYGNDEATAIVLRAAVNPAMTTVPGWAAELAQTSNAAFMDRLMTESIYGPLSAAGARYDLGRNAAIKIPTRANTPRASGAWVGEGAPKPVKRIGLTSLTLTPHKLAVISTFTEEMAMYSTPAIEGLLRQAMSDDTSESLDGFLIDDVAASSVRPAGLLNGVTPLTPSAATTTTEAMIADLKALVGAIIGNGGGRNIVILMNPAQSLGIGFAQTSTGDFVFTSTDEAGRKFNARFIVSRTVPAGTVIAVDAADFATITGDAPRFAVSNEATLHEEDTAPLALVTGAQGAGVVASPMRSLFQTDSVAIRLSLFVSWGMRRAGMVATVDGVAW